MASAEVAGSDVALTQDGRLQALFGDVAVSGTDAGLKRFAKLLIGAGVLTVIGSDVDIYSWKMMANPKAFIITGSDATLLKARGVWLQTVFSHAAGRNTVSAEKVRRATAQPRITGV